MGDYHSFIFDGGRLVGDFEGAYRASDDPWEQSAEHHVQDTRRQLAVTWAERLGGNVVELGCGFGHMTAKIRESGLNVVGIDISPTAIERAKERHPECSFRVAGIADFSAIVASSPDVIIMAELTWYVLDELDQFLADLRAYAKDRVKPTYLIHLLATYAPGVQKYGIDKFTNLDEIRAYFALDYLEAGTIFTARPNDPLSQGTYFIARV